MHCPYCISEIDDKALACPFCQRDLYLFKPLLARIEALETRVNEQDAQLAQLSEMRIGAESDTPAPAGESGVFAPDDSVAMPGGWVLSVCWILPLALLLIAHGLITIVYDLNYLYLRILSLLIPLPFGFLLVRRQRRPGWLLAALAVGLSVVGALAMSWIVARVDGVPVLPASLREWREFAEYVASMSFSYVTGIIIANALRIRAQRFRFSPASGVLALAQLVKAGSAKSGQVQEAAKKFHDLGSSLMASATTAISIYTGLRGFFGD